MSQPRCPPFSEQRARMVEEQIKRRGISDPALLTAIGKVPRHNFVPLAFRDQAYTDRPLPIGLEETISQPYVVAFMIEELRIQPRSRVLEIGTGSGYQTALLAELGAQVYSIEINERLFREAKRRLDFMGYCSVKLLRGDGCAGWPGNESFTQIIVSAASSEIPRRLVDQLEPQGRMIFPFGEEEQVLILLRKSSEGITTKELGSVRFVRMHEGG